MTIIVPRDAASSGICDSHVGVADLIAEAFSDDTQAWYGRGADMRPDFLIVGPTVGIALVSVPSWNASDVIEAGYSGVVLRDGSRHDPVSVMGKIMEGLRLELDGVCDADLIRPLFALPGFTPDELAQPAISDYFMGATVFAAKTMTPTEWATGVGACGALLHRDLIQAIRASLFPETVFEVRPRAGDPERGSRSKVRIELDANQQSVAANIGSGTTLLTGVAGSGKTLVLAARARHLARLHPDWHIQVLCYNKTLRVHLRTLIGVEVANVTVDHLHGWRYRMNVSSDKQLEHAVGRGIPAERYEAVLVDEVQDFQPVWLKFIQRTLKSNCGGLLMAGDMAQAIYSDGETGADSSSDGIQVLDLSVNYRNTEQIGRFAWGAVFGVDSDSDACGQKVTGRDPFCIAYTLSGPPVQVAYAASQAMQARMIVQELQRLVADEGFAYKDIGVLHGNWRQGQLLTSELAKFDVPHMWVSKDKQAKDVPGLGYNAVKVITIHSCKGLDFSVIFLLGVDALKVPESPRDARDPEAISRLKLVYVGMTRARDLLYVTYSKVNPVMRRALALGEFCEARQYPEDFE